MGGDFTEIKNKKILGEIIDWALHIIIAVVIGLLIVKYVAQITIVNKTSMLPTLQDGNVLIVEKISQKLGKLHRGDIVTINDIVVGEKKEIIVKRIIALENDTVEIKDGKVYVNDKELKENYINGNTTLEVNPQYSKLIVPKGYIYVLGDNRLPGQSLDSRTFGPVKVKQVRGKVIFRLLPLNKFGKVK